MKTRATTSAMLAAFAALAVATGGCGEGVLLGGDHSDNGAPTSPLRLTLAYAVTLPSTTNTLSTNLIASGMAIPLGGASVDYSEADRLTISSGQNANPIRYFLAGPASNYMVGNYCFDVTGIDVSRYSKIRFEGRADGGSSNAINTAPNSDSITIGLWNHAANDYYPSVITSGGSAIFDFEFTTGPAFITPAAATTPVSNAVIGQCIFLTIVSSGQTSGAPPYSVIGVQHLRLYLDP